MTQVRVDPSSPDGNVVEKSQASHWPHGKRLALITLCLLTIAYMLSLLDRTVITLLVDFIRADLEISDTQFGLLQGLTFGLFYLFAGIPIGWLVDRMSRVRILAVGIAIWSGMTILSGFASKFAHLFLMRIGVAVGEASVNPAGYSLLADLFPRERLGFAVAIFSAGSMAGTGLAYAFGGALVSILGAQPEVVVPLLGELRIWQVAFLVAGAPGILLALLMIALPEPARAPVQQRQSGHQPFQEVLQFIKQRRLLIFLHFSAFSLMTVQAYSFLTWGPALLLRAHGMSAGTVGMAMGVATGVFGIFGFFAGGWLADYLLRKGYADAHMRVGLLAMLASLPVAIIAVTTSDAVIASVALSPLMFFLMAPVPGGVAGLQLMTPPRLRGQISAFYMVVVNLAGLGLGPVLAALLNDFVFPGREALSTSLAIVSILVIPLSALAFELARHRLGKAIADMRNTQVNLIRI